MARKLFVLVLIFAGCYLGAHYWLRWRNRVTTDSEKRSRLIECEPNEVRSLRIVQKETGKEVVLRFTRADAPMPGVPAAVSLAEARWMMLDPVSGEADASILSRLSSVVCGLHDPLPIREDALLVPGDSGRRASLLEITLDGKTHAIEFGGVSADRMNGVRYRSATEDRTVKIPLQLVQLATAKPESYLNRKLTRTEPDNVQAATVARNGKEAFRVEREGADWRVLVSGKPLVGANENNGRFVNRLATLKALNVREAAGAGDECAGKPHRVTVVLEGVAGKQETLGFDYGKNGLVQACSSLRDTRFEAHRDLIPYLELPAARLK